MTTHFPAFISNWLTAAVIIFLLLCLLLGVRFVRWWRGSDRTKRPDLPGLDEEWNPTTLARSRLSSGQVVEETSLAGQLRRTGSRNLAARRDPPPVGQTPPAGQPAAAAADDDWSSVDD